MLSQKIKTASEHRYFLPLLLLLFFLFNIFCAYHTELLNDEAHYWLYSQFPAWGYFDHPPMIALFTGIGYHIFRHELGVRLLSILAGCATLWVLYKIIAPKNKLLFVVILISSTPLMVASFYAAPDIPLLFFSACFLWVYKHFLEEETYKNTLLLGILIALLMYTKEHAVLLFGFILLSNLKLLQSKKFYLAIVVGVLFFLPHLYWQYLHNFAPYRFHLFEERSHELYNIDFTFHYLYSQIAMSGLPAGVLLIFASYKNNNKTQFSHSLKYLLWGVYIFFFISTFRGRTEANWTAINSLPLIILSYETLSVETTLRKWVYYLAPLSLLLFLSARLLLASEKVVDFLHLKTDCHHYHAWADTIESRAKDRPVVFMNSYQKASKYIFYTGKLAISLNNVMGRKNQFNFWNLEDSIQGKQIYFYSMWGVVPDKAVSIEDMHTPIDDFKGVVCDSFISYSKATITTSEKSYETRCHKTFNVNCQFELEDSSKIILDNAYIRYQYFDDNKHLVSDSSTNLKLKDCLLQKNVTIPIHAPNKKGTYYLLISISVNNYPPAINSKRIKVRVAD